MRKQHFIQLILVGIFFLTTGCQTNFETAESPQEITPNPVEAPLSTSQTVPTTQGETMTSPTPDTSGLESLIDIAKNDLAKRFAISINQIIFTEATEAEWSDSSLDCPRPGMVYMQVITPGYLITLEANGQIYEYHASRAGQVIYCENTVPSISPPKP